MKYQFEEKEIKSCSSCPLSYEQLHLFCSLANKNVEKYFNKKPEWCPLIEITKEQGRH